MLIADATGDACNYGCHRQSKTQCQKQTAGFGFEYGHVD
jgi:hypothetical protein